MEKTRIICFLSDGASHNCSLLDDVPKTGTVQVKSVEFSIFDHGNVVILLLKLVI